MAIDRTAFNATTDDDGSNTVGTVVDKQFIEDVLLDPMDAALAGVGGGGGSHGVCEGRLTLTSGTPVTTADVTGATSLYFTPYQGNQIGLYDGAAWAPLTFTETTGSLGTLTNDLPYDVFGYLAGSVLALEFVAWTSKTARATALAVQDGVLVKSGGTSRRYLGTFHTTSTTTTEDSKRRRLLWNYTHRARRPFYRIESAASWTYTLATVRQANANVLNQVECVVGVEGPVLDLTVLVAGSSSGTNYAVLGIGEDSTTVMSANALSGATQSAVADKLAPASTYLRINPAIGYHFYPWLEYAQASNVFTWWQSGWGAAGVKNAGMSGWIEG